MSDTDRQYLQIAKFYITEKTGIDNLTKEQVSDFAIKYFVENRNIEKKNSFAFRQKERLKKI